jgi:hypothetical protein
MYNIPPMRGTVGTLLALACLLAGATGCGGDDDTDDAATAPSVESTTTASDRQGATTTTVDVATRVEESFGALHRSTIAEIPGLIALFYHDPGGWAVEDVSLDNGATWCRHAWYTWQITDVVSEQDYRVNYTTTAEDCAPLGPLVLHVTGRSEGPDGVVLTGEYTTPANLHVERTVCEGTIEDWDDVCGLSSGLGEPTAKPPTA